jgi:hypothetical protein
MKILDIIKPIQLLSGSHEDTGSTGQGCAMNVIAYLNGEPQITDESPCVCVTVRKPLIWVNDYMNDSERQQLLPFVMRAMGSATEDRAEMSRRLGLLVEMAKDYSVIAQRHAATYSAAAAANANAANAAYAAAAAAANANAAYAAYSAAAAAANANANAAYAAAANANAEEAANADYAAAGAAARQEIIARMLRYFDEALPAATEPQQVHIERAQKLAALANA